MLRENLSIKLKDALKAKQQRRVATLRLILAALKDRDIQARGEERGEGITEAEIMQLLEAMVRQREEAITLYDRGGRPELADQEREEITIIREFMPRQLSDEEILDAVKKAIDETGAAGLKDMGSVMGSLREKYSGQMDFAKAGRIAKGYLS